MTRIAVFLVMICLQPFATGAQTGKVLVLDDFETQQSRQRWQGPMQLSQGNTSHGRQSALIRMGSGQIQLKSTDVPRDWSPFDRLLFDIYSDRETPTTASLRIYDNTNSNDANDRNSYFDARNKLLLLKGWNHIEVNLPGMQAESYLRELDRRNITQITFSFESSPWTLYLDNLRLVSGNESSQTSSRTAPQDAVCRIDNRWVTTRQVARPEDVPESPDISRLRRDAAQEAELLQQTIRAAQLQGIETIYQERYLVTADLGLKVRPLLPWFNNDSSKRSMFSYVTKSCRNGRRELEDQLIGTGPRREVDDTQMPPPLVPPLPSLKGRPIKDGFFRNDQGEPLMVLSLHSPSQVLQRFFATPLQHIESYSVGGGSRWSIDTSPVYQAFQEDIATHRVGWDGWCGHLVRDLSSMGGTKRENVSICLESDRIKKAVSEYIKINIPKFHENPNLLYDILAYELMYICYCDRSHRMFHEWLAKRHGTIAKANQVWETSYREFREVAPPPVENSRPLPHTNRALWYDWARFNQDRFTGYLIWVRNEVRKIDPTVPLAAGGSSSMTAGRTGTTGIDEERIVNEVDDLIIHEGGGSTLEVDLQLALSEEKKPLADPEMSLQSVANLLPHFLHGKSVAQIYHWPSQPANEFHSNTQSSLPHSWRYSLADIGELLRVALDVRRLNREIASFSEAPAEVAILYSQTSTLQLPPEMLTWQTTPYLAELHRMYEASRHLDAKVTFVTERQALKGWLSRYKLLLIPAVRNLPQDVFDAILKYVSEGGHVLIVPESLLGDEYNRPQNYLAKLGISVDRTLRPKPSRTSNMVQGYDQSFSQSVQFEAEKQEALTPVNAGSQLTSGGLRQVMRIDANAIARYRYSDGTPAIASRRLGKGTIDYASCNFEKDSYSRLLDSMFTDAGVSRPIRLLGSKTRDVEARYAHLRSRELFYVFNQQNESVQLKVEIPGRSLHSMQDLRDQKVISGEVISIPPQQTSIFELFFAQTQ